MDDLQELQSRVGGLYSLGGTPMRFERIRLSERPQRETAVIQLIFTNKSAGTYWSVSFLAKTAEQAGIVANRWWHTFVREVQ